MAHIAGPIQDLITPDGEPYEDGMLIIGITIVHMRNAYGGMSAAEQHAVAILDWHYDKITGRTP